jgi:hypothetical protein
MPVLSGLSGAFPASFSEHFRPGDKPPIFSGLPQSADSASEISIAKSPKTGLEPGISQEQNRHFTGAKPALQQSKNWAEKGTTPRKDCLIDRDGLGKTPVERDNDFSP